MVIRQKIRALVFIRIKSEKFDHFRKYCSKIKYIKEIYKITGEYDSILEIEVDSTNDIYDLYKYMINFEGIQSMNTHIIMKEWNK